MGWDRCDSAVVFCCNRKETKREKLYYFRSKKKKTEKMIMEDVRVGEVGEDRVYWYRPGKSQICG